MTQMKQIGDTQATKPRVCQFDQRLGSVTHHIQHLRAKRCEALVGALEPGVKAAIRRGFFHQQIARSQIHEYQHHALEKGLVDGPNDGPYLAMGDAFFLPRRV